MCRLFGYVADRPTAVIDGLGVPAYEAFTSLSALHGDGWGMAWRRAADVDPEVVTSPLAAAHDPRYDELAHQALGSAGVVHLRWATDGLAVAVENTHPFAADGYAMDLAPRRVAERNLTGASRGQHRQRAILQIRA
jgi:predicted glutamine amidotransferase